MINLIFVEIFIISDLLNLKGKNAIQRRNITSNLFVSLARASLRGHLNVSICMQRITRICIRWNHVMHADRSLAK